ncbi:MAG TPA: 16S rRNA (guanine(527)-N(7))-methyltransferase RsmG [Pyrinomonadaceae bacterium]|nr:16S rRNA (guanine(527)-N(7))-methyltransferase RsmG [Pyrinomonadaceae bacterium]
MPDELERFRNALLANWRTFDFPFSSDTATRLGIYYSLLTRWNERLHLVAPCSPEEFATRHVLESLMLLEHLPHGAKIADIGSGGGLPIIPCLIARADLEVTLIESSQKKAVFLREALKEVGRSATIIARRFEEIEAPDVEFVTSRALDQFIRKIPVLLAWVPKGSTLLLFGGENLLDAECFLIPGSEKRYLYVRRDFRG